MLRNGALVGIEFPYIAEVRYAHSNTLGGINHAAAAYSQYQFHPFLPAECYSFPYECHTGVRLDSAELYIADSCCVQTFSDTVEQPGADDTATAIMQQYLTADKRVQQPAGVEVFTGAVDIPGGITVVEIQHGSILA